MKVFFHERHELFTMYGEIAAQQEDKEVMQHPVVKTIHQERFQHTVIRQAVDINVEASAEARPVVKGNLQGKKYAQPGNRQPANNRNPQRHQQVKPQENDHKVKLVFGIAEEQNG